MFYIVEHEWLLGRGSVRIRIAPGYVRFTVGGDLRLQLIAGTAVSHVKMF
jgi:hypothetical protein